MDGNGASEHYTAFVSGKNSYYCRQGLETEIVDKFMAFHAYLEKPEETQNREENIGAILTWDMSMHLCCS